VLLTVVIIFITGLYHFAKNSNLPAAPAAKC